MFKELIGKLLQAFRKSDEQEPQTPQIKQLSFSVDELTRIFSPLLEPQETTTENENTIRIGIQNGLDWINNTGLEVGNRKIAGLKNALSQIKSAIPTNLSREQDVVIDKTVLEDLASGLPALDECVRHYNQRSANEQFNTIFPDENETTPDPDGLIGEFIFLQASHVSPENYEVIRSKLAQLSTNLHTLIRENGIQPKPVELEVDHRTDNPFSRDTGYDDYLM